MHPSLQEMPWHGDEAGRGVDAPTLVTVARGGHLNKLHNSSRPCEHKKLRTKPTHLAVLSRIHVRLIMVNLKATLGRESDKSAKVRRVVVWVLCVGKGKNYHASYPLAALFPTSVLLGPVAYFMCI